MSKDRSIGKLALSAGAGIVISIFISAFLLTLELSEWEIVVSVIIIIISAILSGVAVIKIKRKSHRITITLTHHVSFITLVILQQIYTETIKNFLGKIPV